MSSEVDSKKEKRDTASRGWLITIPADRYSREEIVEALGGYDVVVAQLERGGKTDYLHWQTWVEHSAPIRFSTLQRRLPGCHLVARKAPKRKAYEYVTKKDTRVEGVDRIIIGEPEKLLESRQGERTDIERVREAVLEDGLSVDEVLLEVPESGRFVNYVRELVSARDRREARGVERDVHVTYLFGEPGVGKTRWLYDNYDDVARLTEYRHFDAYDGQKVLALDEFGGQIDLRLLNGMLDRYPLDLPARYYDRPARYEEVVILSNLPPWSLYDWEQPVVRQAFARRLHRVLMMDADGHVQEVDADSVRSRFGVVNAATPAAALEAVPAAVDAVEEPAATADALELEGEQPPF